jgi:hypothetical protein
VYNSPGTFTLIYVQSIIKEYLHRLVCVPRLESASLTVAPQSLPMSAMISDQEGNSLSDLHPGPITIINWQLSLENTGAVDFFLKKAWN